MPSSSVVATPQMVRMIKRGENGSSSVSMKFLGLIWPYQLLKFAAHLRFGPALGATIAQQASRRTGRVYDVEISAEAIPVTPLLLQCSNPARINGRAAASRPESCSAAVPPA